MRIRARDCKSWNRPQEMEAAKTQIGNEAEQQDWDNTRCIYEAGGTRDEVKKGWCIETKQFNTEKFILTGVQLFSSSILSRERRSGAEHVSILKWRIMLPSGLQHQLCELSQWHQEDLIHLPLSLLTSMAREPGTLCGCKPEIPGAWWFATSLTALYLYVLPKDIGSEVLKGCCFFGSSKTLVFLVMVQHRETLGTLWNCWLFFCVDHKVLWFM